MLFVDLDKSLIKSDYLIESFINYFSKNIFAPFISFYIYLRGGKVALKKFLYENSDITVENLPFNKKVLEIIKNWKKKHPDEKVYLISASFYMAVNDIAQFLNCFDGSYGTLDENLKSTTKLKKIKELSSDKEFTYIGDSIDDVVIWKNAKQCILVNPSKTFTNKVKKINSSVKIIDSEGINLFKEIFKTIRVHQWAKNILLFVPIILSLKPFYESFNNLMSGFIAFSLIASAFYILNDLFDIENDRNHYLKKSRSFASGSLSIPKGCYVFCILVITAIVISIELSQSFHICLFIYAISTFVYSKYLKKIPIIDILTLSYLYLLRIITGGALVGISISNWLLTFSVFFFLFLAAVKRWIELNKLSVDLMPGRGYQISDVSFVSQLSYFSGLISVLIICLYIESQQALTLYDSSKIFWFIPVILLYWILETLFRIERDQVDDDPVKYALKSKTSYICLLGLILIIIIASST